MIPNVTKKGTSFKGAAAYYFHDKQAQTQDRIEFTHTINLATDNPDMAAKMMAYTAMHQSEIKQAAGGVAKGRKLTQPVYAFSLAWHPTQTPSREHMIETGFGSLEILGLVEHEAVMVAHNDEEHKHLHIIVNRVHPENGIAAKLSNDRLKLSKWAEDYERKQGEILCHQRVENNKRRKNEFVKHRENQNKAEYHRWQRQKTKEAVEKRQEEEKHLSSLHKKQRDDLYESKTARINKRLSEIREENRPIWASLYRQQDHERVELRNASHSALGRLHYYIKNRDRDPAIKRPTLSGSFKSILGNEHLYTALHKRHERERKVFASNVSARKSEAYGQSNVEYFKQYDLLKNAQHDNHHIMSERHSRESKKRASDIASGKLKEEFDRKKKAQEFRDTYNISAEGKFPDVKSEFNKDIDSRVLRYMKQQEERGSNDNEKNDSGVKKEFNKDIDFRVLRYMKQQEEDKERDKAQESSKDRDFDREPD